jgi:uncharacterized delta-60 repeat protein
MTFLRRWVALTLAALVIPACGGGGGGSSTPPPAAPASAPGGFAATPGNTQVGLVWAAVADATSYNVYQAAVSGGPYTLVTNVAVLNHTVTGLTNGTTYFFIVRAANAGGEGPASLEVSGVPVLIPGVPGGFAATWGNTQVTLGWTAATDATSYNVYQATVSGGPYTLVLNVAILNHTVTGLTNGTTYFFIVRGSNASGEGPASVELSGAPNTVPAAPATLNATPGDTVVDLTWGAVGGVTGYRVERATVTGGPYTIVITLGAVTTYSDTGRTNGTTYFYVVRGLNGSVIGPASPEASATPTAPPLPTFNQARGADGTVVGISPATDGSGDIYITGDLSSFGNTAIQKVARINSNGTVDGAFNTGTGFGNGSGNCVAAAVDVAGNALGDVYVGGSFATYNGTAGINNIVRLNADGSRDATFDTGTGFDLPVFVIAAALDGSGDIYVGGQFSTYKGVACTTLIRLNNDGTRDLGFATGTGFTGVVSSLAVDAATGDIYVGGTFTAYDGTAAIRLVRLNSNGTVDGAFDTTTGADAWVRAIALATDGSGDVYIAGDFTGWKGTAARYVLRLNSDGSLDGAFATGMTFGNSVRSLAVPAGGDVYAGGTFVAIGIAAISRIVRLNSDGSVDAAFDVGSGANSTVEALCLATDGSGDLFMGGAFTSYKGTGIDRVARVNTTDGTVDAGLPSGSGFNAEVRAVALPPGGDVYAVGTFTNYNGTTANNIVRLNSDGTIDAGFNTGIGFAGVGAFAAAMAADGSGDVYVGGNFTSYHINPVQNIVRINSDGTIDTVFDTATGFNSVVRAIAPVPAGINVATDGDVYVGGLFTGYKGTPGINRIVRLNSDGTIDAAFNVGTGFDADVYTLLVDATGKIYVGGNFQNYNGLTGINRIVRLNPDGTVDAAFDTGTGADFSVSAIALATDGTGDVFAGGNFSNYRGAAASKMVRINSDGTRDTGFTANLTGEVTALLPLTGASTDIYVGGRLQFQGATALRHLVRLNADGTHDPGFLAASQGFRFADQYVYTLAFVLDATGRFYAGGNVTGFRGQTMDFLGRITSTAGLE